jgi:sigma-B regulation protein RsbU (phosphoserine phosphatase)
VTRSFWQSLPPRPLFFLLAAAFFTFGAWGFVDDMRTFGARSHPQLATMVVLSGVIAALYAWSAMRARRLLPLVVLFHVLAFPSESLAPSGEPALPQLPAQVQALRERFTLDSAGIAVFIVLGYAFFVRLVAYEGVAHLRAQKEIHLAQEIHTRLVPAFHERRGAFEVSGLCRPSGAVGGDLVDVVATPDGWTALVADVSGHGVAAGLLMGMVKSAARMRLASAASAGELLDDLNRVLFPLKAANMFVTCACLRHAGGGTLEYALAGHLPVLHWRAADGTMAELAGPHLPLGIVADHEYAPSTVSFASGDLFAVLTDGLTEVADAQGRELGLEGVKRLVAGNADRPLDALMEAVMTGTRAHGTPHDDQTLLLVRCE